MAKSQIWRNLAKFRPYTGDLGFLDLATLRCNHATEKKSFQSQTKEASVLASNSHGRSRTTFSSQVAAHCSPINPTILIRAR